MKKIKDALNAQNPKASILKLILDKKSIIEKMATWANLSDELSELPLKYATGKRRNPEERREQDKRRSTKH